jgi:hypothetical protein
MKKIIEGIAYALAACDTIEGRRYSLHYIQLWVTRRYQEKPKSGLARDSWESWGRKV